MAEYIEREALIEKLNEVPAYFDNGDIRYGIDIATQQVIEQPTADVVEVVRCKNCAVPHNKWTGCPKLNGLIPPLDFYCGYGELKEREGK